MLNCSSYESYIHSSIATFEQPKREVQYEEGHSDFTTFSSDNMTVT